MKYEIIKDIPLYQEGNLKFSFGGGCMIATCLKCNKDISAEEVNFPGTKEQREQCIGKMKQKLENHKC